MAARSGSGNSDSARRQDLARWARTLRTGRGHSVDDGDQLEVGRDLAELTTGDLTTDAILAALKAHRARLELST